jgi:DNA-binding transcriptional ArsR family regulator
MTERKTMRKYPKLDDYCREILVFLVVIGEKKRFNKLYEFLREKGMELTKPTLSLHLKHLTREKMVIREVKDAQIVYYEVNHKRFRDFEETVKSQHVIRMIEFLDQEKQAFDSASLQKQIDIVFDTMILRNLRHLKTQIEFESNSVRKWEKSLELQLLENPLFMVRETWLVAKCAKDEEYRGKVLQEINGLIRGIEDRSHGPP